MHESGDQDHQAVFKQWAEEHRGLVFKVANGFAHTGPDREDLSQEIFAQIWRSIPGWEPRAKPSTWIYRRWPFSRPFTGAFTC